MTYFLLINFKKEKISGFPDNLSLTNHTVVMPYNKTNENMSIANKQHGKDLAFTIGPKLSF